MNFIISMNDISFTSKYQIVDSKTFEKCFQKGAYVDFRANNDLSALDLKEIKRIEQEIGSKINHPRLDIVKADEFNTGTVRTCAAGGVVDTKNGEAAGFHIFDCLFNFETIDDILENLFWRVKNPDRAFIIGSKTLTNSDYSKPIFRELHKGISQRVPKVTVFREHVFPYSESDIHYSVKNDTWTIHSMYKPLTDYRQYDVLAEEDLHKCYKEIKMADGDVLIFPENK